jgi:hypothetical protein
MPLFGKKKVQQPVDTNYQDWDKDLGFLTLILTRKKNITKNYFINIFKTQLKETDYITDEDLFPIIQQGVEETMSEISESYKQYLITKYFRSEAELIKFVTEDFYVDLTTAAITQNGEKIKLNIIRKNVSSMSQKINRNEQPDEAEQPQPEEQPKKNNKRKA